MPHHKPYPSPPLLLEADKGEGPGGSWVLPSPPTPLSPHRISTHPRHVLRGDEALVAAIEGLEDLPDLLQPRMYKRFQATDS